MPPRSSKPLAALFATSLVLSACAASTPPTEESESVALHSIVVLPAFTAADLSGDLPEAEKTSLAEGAHVVNELVAARVTDQEAFHLLTPQQREAMTVTAADRNLNAQALAIGRAMKADGVLFLTVNRFQEREGTDYSVDRPASVAFEVRLLATESGASLCYGDFDEEQKSATENLLKIGAAFRRGFKWISARDLASEGISQKFATCRHLK